MDELRFRWSLMALDDPTLPLSNDPTSAAPTGDRIRRMQQRAQRMLLENEKTASNAGSVHSAYGPWQRAAGEPSPPLQVNGRRQSRFSRSLYDHPELSPFYSRGASTSSHAPPGAQLQRFTSTHRSRNQTAVPRAFFMKTPNTPPETMLNGLVSMPIKPPQVSPRRLERSPSQRAAAGEPSPPVQVNRDTWGRISRPLSVDSILRQCRAAQLGPSDPSVPHARWSSFYAPPGAQLQRFTSTHRSRNQTAVPRALSVKTPNTPPETMVTPRKVYGSYWRETQTTVKHDRSPSHRQNERVFAGVEPDGGWWASTPNEREVSTQVTRRRTVEENSPSQRILRKNTTKKSVKYPPEMGIGDAVNMLTQADTDAVIYAATYIQHKCLCSDDAKTRVRDLNGIEKLNRLICNDSEEVQQVAAAALRNVVYKNDENKEKLWKMGGLKVIVRTLKKSRDLKTRQNITGLLWNLSAHERLKADICNQFLEVLTQICLFPGSVFSEDANPKEELLADAVVFQHVTGCLRNLSSTDPQSRNAMRKDSGLIKTLVFYVQKTVAEKTDDQSTENCIGILCNLSYDVKAETNDLKDLGENFQHALQESPQLAISSEPTGVEWLWSPLVVRLYSSILACSRRPDTQEATIGALHNITFTKNLGNLSGAVAQNVVKMEGFLACVKNMFEDGESRVRFLVMSLIKNLSSHRPLQLDFGPQVVSYVTEKLPNVSMDTELKACMCDILTLCMTTVQNAAELVKSGVLPIIISISREGNGEASSSAVAASRLLYAMWQHRKLRKLYRKRGFKKHRFINATTKAVLNKNSGTQSDEPEVSESSS